MLVTRKVKVKGRGERVRLDQDHKKGWFQMKAKCNRKPSVRVNCVANHYTNSSERIIEYSFGSDDMGNGIGGLIAFSYDEKGNPRVELYRHDSIVKIAVGKPS